MTFLTILGVIEILCSFRLVVEEKISKETLENIITGIKSDNKLTKPEAN